MAKHCPFSEKLFNDLLNFLEKYSQRLRIFADLYSPNKNETTKN